MATNIQTEEIELADATPRAPIERDPTFSRHMADVAFAYSVRRDIDLAFVAMGPELFEEIDDAESGRRAVYAEAGRSEVARVRMHAGAAVALAMDILREAIPAGKLKIDPVRRDLQAIIDSLGSKPETPDSEANTDS